MHLLKALGKRTLALAPIRASALKVAGVRRRGLVLVYHRVTTEREGGVVPSVTRDVFRAQIETLLDAGQIVSIEALLGSEATGGRPRFAVTLDDDLVSHYDVALPVLQSLNVTATFFLCGRRLHGLGPAWFDIVDALVRRHGLATTCDLIGANARSVEELALECERSKPLQQAVVQQQASVEEMTQQLGAQEIAALSKANMTMGFHTVRHSVLPSLDDDFLEHEIIDGRDALAAAASQPISLFAYPHGKATSRVARAVRDAGYRAAVTGQPIPTTRRSDRFLLGRWEPGPLEAADFLTAVAVKLNRSG
jgi:peptidoglycan/xylan/chitin deacetylase (PgdA/CDA1 family)